MNQEEIEILLCDNDIQRACFYGYFNEVKNIIENNNNDQYKDQKLVILAANYDHMNIVNYLITKNFNCDEYHPILFSGNTALMLFIENHNIYGVIDLLKFNCNIEHKNLIGQTPLLLAVKLGYISIVKKLIEYGANVNVLDNNNFSPLLIAISIKNKEIIRLLINAKADVNYMTTDSNNDPIAPLDYAHKYLSVEININKYILHKDYISIIKDLLKAGAKTRYNLDHNIIGIKRSIYSIS